jgi:aldehyde:ferredoxin oxidoreductase
MGPVTPLEYESRAERYDEQLMELGISIEGKNTTEKIKVLRSYRENQYVKLQDAVYKKRGWTKSGCPTIKSVRELGIDYPDVIAYIKPHQDI